MRRVDGKSWWMALGLAVFALVGITAGAGATVSRQARAEVSGPISGGAGTPQVATTSFDLSEVGYEQSEFLISGTAHSYEPKSRLTNDGKWKVAAGETAPFTTRAVVYRPEDPKKFNGTVLVEWLNVSGLVDAGPDWVMTHTELVREGIVWVGVSAQAVGANATKGSDPERYASMTHPGDSFSYDIYSQAGRAVRQQAAKVLGGLAPKRVLAAGESQSAARMVTYINAVQLQEHVYDGFLVHSRGALAAPLRGSATTAIGPPPDPNAPPLVVAPSPTAIRTDLDVPVLVVQAETDVFNGNLSARQPDTDKYRLWEIAGTAHYDTYGLTIGTHDIGDGKGAVESIASMQHPSTSASPGIIECNLPINTGAAHWVLNAAVFSLNKWVTKGTPPPIAPRLETMTIAPVVFALDAVGNAIGGIRTPHVDAPIASLGGTTNSGTGTYGQFCRLFGTTVPFTPEQLSARYADHDAFVAQWNKSVDAAVKSGFLVPADAKELKDAAAASTVGE